MTIGDRLIYRGEWHAVANVAGNGVWLVSLERREAIPFLADVTLVSQSDRAKAYYLGRQEASQKQARG